jgi:two-component SAPR family response regulator
MASNTRELMFFLVRAGKPVRQRRIIKKIAAEKNLKKMRQKGVKLWRAILVATKERPQKRTAVAKAR